MRSKFSELIAAGVASFNHEPIAPQTPCHDPICHTYNNLWGVLTDTHMSCADGRYVITGTFVGDPKKWSSLMWTPNWGGCNFIDSGYYSLSEFLCLAGYEPRTTVLNGQAAIELIPREDCVCTGIGCTAYTTHESQIPQPVARLGRVQECLNVHSLQEAAKNMNRSSVVEGTHWHVSGDKIVGEAFGKTVILEVNFDKGIKIENKVLAELLDNEGIGEFYYRQFPRYFALDSDDKKWQALLRRDENNKIFVKNFSDLTPQEWFEEAKAIITRYN